MAKVALTAEELQRMATDAGQLRGNSPDNVPLGPLRANFMRLIGEVWRLRGKVRYLAARLAEHDGSRDRAGIRAALETQREQHRRTLDAQTESIGVLVDFIDTRADRGDVPNDVMAIVDHHRELRSMMG